MWEVATHPGKPGPVPPSACAGHVLVLTLCLAWVSHDYGSCWQLSGPWVRKQKRNLELQGEMMLKKATVYWCLFFFHSKIFSYSLSFISIKYGWLHFLRNFISLRREFGEIIQEDSTKKIDPQFSSLNTWQNRYRECKF